MSSPEDVQISLTSGIDNEQEKFAPSFNNNGQSQITPTTNNHNSDLPHCDGQSDNENNSTNNQTEVVAFPKHFDSTNSPSDVFEHLIPTETSPEGDEDSNQKFSNEQKFKALEQRRQPLRELIESEEGYLRRLRLIRECYIPLGPDSKTPLASAPDLGSNMASLISGNTAVGDCTSSKEIHVPPTLPDDLAARWRILWGNWIQLFEWHVGFYDKLTTLIDTDPDKIAKLFIDSKPRLRSIYSKYCENHRKAALIAEQYRDYFDDLRLHLGDKEDVVSHLMQPVQRIMRYQLPIAEIVKYTKRAASPDLPLWERALEIMKEIPKNTQLILEAARIDGFPGVITTLGNILLRGDLLVATVTRDQLLEAVTGYKATLQEARTVFNSSTTASSSFVSLNGGGGNIPRHQSMSVTSPTPSATNNLLDIAAVQASSLSTTSVGNVTSDPPPPSSSFSLNTVSSCLSHSNVAAASPVPPPASIQSQQQLYCGSMKFVESRLFLFEQMLVITEEIRPKRRQQTASESFIQSTYQFRAAINVNKMRYESHWYNCSLPNGHTNADAGVVDQLLNCGLSPDDLRFAILNQKPGCDVVYVIDPINIANRGLWVVQLRDIQRMQQEFLLALQDPRRFNTGARDEGYDSQELPSSSSGRQSAAAAESPISISPGIQPVQSSHQPQQRQRKWPSFTMKRANRHSSTSMAPSSATVMSKQPEPTSGSTESNVKVKSLARSLSAERGKLDDSGVNLSPTGSSAGGRPTFRKGSLSASNSIKISNMPCNAAMSQSVSGDSSKSSSTKRLNRFVGLFSRNKSKGRSGKQQASSPTQRLSPIRLGTLPPPSGGPPSYHHRHQMSAPSEVLEERSERLSSSPPTEDDIGLTSTS